MFDMDWSPDDETDTMLWHMAIQNAIEYSGKAAPGSVIGRLMSIRQDLRQYGKVLSPLIAQKVAQANKLASDEGLDYLREILKNEAPELLEEREKQVKREGLPELPNAVKGKVVLRFAPNPNGPLSFGHARGIIINGEYAREYDGELILRFDDTDTTVKPPLVEAYDIIQQESEWLLGFKPHRVVIASDRIEEYYRHVDLMIDGDFGYVCECSAEAFREFRVSKTNCPCRINEVNYNKELWSKMLDGTFNPGDAVVRVKTDMTLKNPALRDWPALRIQDTIANPHPRENIASKYRVWPLLDFQSAVEDHLQGVTHIIRGKDLMDSTRKQTLLYEHFGWKYPETMYWGRVKVHEWGGFSTSQMRKDIEEGKFSGWSDPRLPTIAGLSGTGIQASALRSFWVELGVTQKDIAVPLATLYSHNIKVIDDNAPRIAFIRDPVEISLVGINETNITIPTHPNHTEMGSRVIDLSNPIVYIEREDLQHSALRLKEFGDFDIDGKVATFVSKERTDKRKIIHWVSHNSSDSSELEIVKDGQLLSIKGRLESHQIKEGTSVQLERIGYGLIGENNKVTFTHN
ncbi:MAG: glutamate--tRNA ligase [Candidatus Thermoplasmatota archaeon]|nr:glutamate--tRNA ligase [Candidatus Thermoplasmatota archaeon]